MAHDVFISHSSKDKPTADAACAVLESKGIRCWVAPRDIAPGADWSESIIDAISASNVMVLLFSHHANESPQIKREVERAVNRGVPILPVRLEDVMPAKSLEYFISTPHWLDAFTAPLEQHLEHLAATVQRLLDDPKAKPPPAPAAAPFIRKHLKAIGVTAATALALLLLLVIALQGNDPGGSGDGAKANDHGSDGATGGNDQSPNAGIPSSANHDNGNQAADHTTNGNGAAGEPAQTVSPFVGKWKLIEFTGTPQVHPFFIAGLFPNVVEAAFSNPDAGTTSTLDEDGKFTMHIAAFDEGTYARPVNSKPYLQLKSKRTLKHDTVRYSLSEVDRTRPEMHQIAGQTKISFTPVDLGGGFYLHRDPQPGVAHDSLIGAWKGDDILIDSPQPYETTLTLTNTGLYSLRIERREQGVMQIENGKFEYNGPNFIQNKGNVRYDKDKDRVRYIGVGGETIWQRITE